MPPPTKRRRTEPTVVEEITFDPAARHEFLTGFHKRKLQRAKHAQEAAEKRARAERIVERKKLREQRKADLERHVEQVNAMLRTTAALDGSEHGVDGTGSADEWSGISDSEPAPVDHEAEYIDEDKYTTVTVEAMDVSREGLFKAEQARDSENPQEEEGGAEAEPENLSEKKKRKWTQEKPKGSVDKPKRKKKRNFRYESKVERKTARSKEKAKNRKQARERRSG
ncbi:hypothetical protein PV05_02141 [Exophiala xenobiotica]|uniref:Ribosomal RNA-processing protein 17 n=1 Tax=Exophiala xenobiotica TaxID=348802 RepID=A0A0D2F544_9EURO|nr:uncharacterized protein PV05_02141 [Exophiala xenobiotica]KIW62090.1 hypothetical protein PV05_02141 [Exophiala xenobiotica]